MKVLLTGGIGFVGSTLTPALLRNDNVDSIVVLDNLRSTANPENIAGYKNSPKFRSVYGDIRDKSLVDGLVSRSDVVIIS